MPGDRPQWSLATAAAQAQNPPNGPGAMKFLQIAVNPNILFSECLCPLLIRLAACRREGSSGHICCFVSACVLHSTGGSDSMEHGHLQRTAADREQASY